MYELGECIICRRLFIISCTSTQRLARSISKLCTSLFDLINTLSRVYCMAVSRMMVAAMAQRGAVYIFPDIRTLFIGS